MLWVSWGEEGVNGLQWTVRPEGVGVVRGRPSGPSPLPNQNKQTQRSCDLI